MNTNLLSALLGSRGSSSGGQRGSGLFGAPGAPRGGMNFVGPAPASRFQSARPTAASNAALGYGAAGSGSGYVPNFGLGPAPMSPADQQFQNASQNNSNNYNASQNVPYPVAGSAADQTAWGQNQVASRAAAGQQQNSLANAYHSQINTPQARAQSEFATFQNANPNASPQQTQDFQSNYAGQWAQKNQMDALNAAATDPSQYGGYDPNGQSGAIPMPSWMKKNPKTGQYGVA